MFSLQIHTDVYTQQWCLDGKLLATAINATALQELSELSRIEHVSFKERVLSYFLQNCGTDIQTTRRVSICGFADLRAFP